MSFLGRLRKQLKEKVSLKPEFWSHRDKQSRCFLHYATLLGTESTVTPSSLVLLGLHLWECFVTFPNPEHDVDQIKHLGCFNVLWRTAIPSL